MNRETAPSQPAFDDVSPDASAMIESMRAQGYTLATAIADLIDNSIAANAKRISLQFVWRGPHSWISISDDGDGMSETELVNAMRLGSQSPVEQRAERDLGRFGLGMKTASFSQARRLTVVTGQEPGEYSLRRWDLDHLARPEVKGWQLLRSPHEESDEEALGISRIQTSGGTRVLLEGLDRVVGPRSDKSSDQEEDYFVSQVARVREHLAMVFHRYLTAPPRSRITIDIGGNPVEAWDPFCESLGATQPFPEDASSVLGHEVRVKGFVLPHRDRFDEEDSVRSAALHRAAAGADGWNAHQGFYLYRNQRLIIAGDWLGLGPGRGGWKKEEHFKLARIRVDIPNALDHEWQIDIKKSSARAPAPLHQWMTGLAQSVRERAKEVYAHRGSRGRRNAPANVPDRPWRTLTRSDGVFSYRIERKHPLIHSLIKAVPKQHHDQVEALLRLIEETVPIQRIWIDTAENQDGVAPPFHGEPAAKLRGLILACYATLREQGCDEPEAWERIRAFEGFQSVDAMAIIGQASNEGEHHERV
jgi:hypothetical protein